MTVLLIGAAGLIGGEAAPALAERGEPVRALVRSGRGLAELRARGVELEPGDARDQRALRRALRGVRAVVLAQDGPALHGRPRDAAEAAAALITAAGAARVEHFVLVSALKADEAPGVPPLERMRDAEERLRASGMGFTILRPSSLQETFGLALAALAGPAARVGLAPTPAGGRAPHSLVAAVDVARAAAVALDHPAARGQAVPVGGPEDITYREAIRRAAGAGGPLRPLPVPLPLLGLWGAMAAPALPGLRDALSLLAFQERAGYTCVTPEWLRAALPPMRRFAPRVTG